MLLALLQLKQRQQHSECVLEIMEKVVPAMDRTKRHLIIFAVVFIILDSALFGSLRYLAHSLADGMFHVGLLSRRLSFLQRRAVAIVTFYPENEAGMEMQRLTMQNKRIYANNHGYDLLVLNDSIQFMKYMQSINRRANWENVKKYVALAAVLGGGDAIDNKQYEWILWSEPEALFLNMNLPLEDIMDERFDVILGTGSSEHTRWTGIYNGGNMLLRNGPFAHDFVIDAFFNSNANCTMALGDQGRSGNGLIVNDWLKLCQDDGTFWSHDAGVINLMTFFKPSEFRCHFKRTSNRAISSEFPAYADGDLAVFFPNKSHGEIRQLVKLFLKFTDFSNGKVDRRFVDTLDPEELYGQVDHAAIEQQYAKYNSPCSAPDNDMANIAHV